MLIICGPSDQRAPIEATLLTIQVDRLEPHVAKLNEAGLEQIQPDQMTPVGRNTRFRNPDGLSSALGGSCLRGRGGRHRILCVEPLRTLDRRYGRWNSGRYGRVYRSDQLVVGPEGYMGGLMRQHGTQC